MRPEVSFSPRKKTASTRTQTGSVNSIANTVAKDSKVSAVAQQYCPQKCRLLRNRCIGTRFVGTSLRSDGLSTEPG